MSLGVLNNLNAMYAENNLNNTSNSLNQVLQQLSSGSKINSGADDAAGLSLVNGLQANSMALAQSQTNAAEGVGLLKVADGALSQVTNLLNRAVTLATEASNGTLNSSQDAAANSEYQSILSEINNIGTTTTYNGQAVFGKDTSIYTGDSSTIGSSIDMLHIGSLSSSNVGNSGGVMSYSNGQSSVFLNLSSATQNANSTDTLNVNGSSTIDVNYLVKGADGSSTAASTSITVGGSSGYSNTVNGMIDAINKSGLGLTATFATQSQAGVAGGGAQTGIQISGGLISVGVDPNTSAATSGSLNPSEITNGDLAIGQTVTVNSGSTNVATFTITSAVDTLDQLATQINAGAGHTGGAATAGMVTASVVYDSNGKETSLQLNGAANTGPLTVNVTAGTVAPSALSAGTVVSAAQSPVSVNFVSGAAGSAGQYASATLAIPGGVADNDPSALNLTGNITLKNGLNSTTYHLNDGSGNSNTATDVYITHANSSLTGLAAAIQGTSTLRVDATASTGGIVITSKDTGTGITTTGSPTLSATLTSGVTSNVAGLAATSGTDGTTVISMTGDGMGISGSTALATGTHITLQNGSGLAYTYTMGTGTGNLVGQATTTAALTAQSLADAINSSTGTTGMAAGIANGVLTVTSNAVNTSIIASANNLSGTQALTATAVNSGNATVDNHSTGNITFNIGDPADNSLTTTGDSLTGSISVTNNGVTHIFAMGTSGGPANSIYTGANTLASLQQAISGDTGLAVNATAYGSAGGSTTGLTLTSTNLTSTISLGGAGISDVSTVGLNAQGSVGSGGSQYVTATLSADNGGVLDPTGAAQIYSGNFAITETGTNVIGGSATLTVHVGTAGANDATNLFVTGSGGKASISDITTAMSAYMGNAVNTGGKKFDFTGSVDANTGGLTVQASAVATTDTALSMTSSTLVATNSLTAGSFSTGTTAGEATVNVGNGAGTIDANNINDVLANGGMLTITNSIGQESTDGTKTVIFTIGNGGTETGDGTGTVTTAANTMSSLISAIKNQTGMDLDASIVNGALQIRSTGASNTGSLTVVAGAGLKQSYGVGNVAGTLTGVTVNAGTGPSGATNAAASINTAAQMSTSGTDVLGGSLVLQNGSGTAVTFNLGNNGGTNSATTVDLDAAHSTQQGLVDAINAKVALGITASINSSTGAIQLQSIASNTAITATSTVTDSTNASALVGGVAGAQNQFSTATISLADSIGGVHNTLANNTNPLTGDISISANGKTIDFVMGGTGASNVSNLTNGSGTITLSAANSTVAGLKAAILAEGSSLNVSVGTSNGSNGLTGDNILLTSDAANGTQITATSNLKDTLGNAPATATLGSYASSSDIVSGTVDFAIGGVEKNLGTIAAGKNVMQLVNFINTGSYGSATALSTPTNANGVTASLVPDTNGYQTIQLTSNTYGTNGNLTSGAATGTALTDHPNSATLSYVANNPYSIGISNVAGTGIYDSSVAGSTAPTTAYAGFTANAGSSSGTATISYSDGAGVSLSATDLSNQTDARAALASLNAAITAVAAQDGYIGAQINTLNSVSSVLATQQQNVVAAQNAVQATDYASAASNMSKYEILSQTGISALAQANSMQQEVTKLLQ